MLSPNQLHHDPTFTLSRCENLAVAAWWDAPTVAQIGVVERNMDVMRRAFRDEMAFVNVIVAGRIESFSKDVREAANRLTEKHPRSLCVANVVLVEGIAGVLTRTIMRAMRMVGRNESPWRVFDNCAAAAAWIAPHLDGHASLVWSSDDVLAVLNQAAGRAQPPGAIQR